MRRSLVLFAALSGPLLAACGETGAFGDVHAIIASTSPDLWAELEEPVVGALQQPIFTIMQETTFRVTYQDPGEAEEWSRLRRFKQLLLIGRPSDPWMVEALAEAEEPLSPPQVLQVFDVWARGQIITMVVLSEDGGADQVGPLLPRIAELYDRQYREYVLAKMFVTGRDSATADSLRRSTGFTVLVPNVYDWGFEDSIYVFRNDNPDPSELIRQVTVTWRTPIPPDFQPEDILAWRESVANEYFSYPQVANLSNVRAEPGSYRGHPSYEIRAVWENPPETWPAAGPFITRAVICRNQNRMYLVDGWLYAPNQDKYEYMIQLETILDSFDCTD